MYKPLNRTDWGVYALLRKENKKQAREWKTRVLKEPRIYYADGYEYDPNDYFNDEPIIWKPFRIYDEEYNSYDCYTSITTIMHRFTEADEREFREYFWIHFMDPYCDGRDCTGAPFTGWMKFLRCKDRTIIIHHVHYDL